MRIIVPAIFQIRITDIRQAVVGGMMNVHIMSLVGITIFCRIQKTVQVTIHSIQTEKNTNVLTRAIVGI